ncbi:MAG: ATP-dependent metallopeptidase FtsH/Yme1/Tma family protein, partial [Pseudomonadota bacterium]|nr:ATP-dependent metallopeptidase FtsH/Yme1/Tma family protein [Pseudomonadota bacterium]
MGRNIIIWLVFGAALLALFNLFQSPSSTSPASRVAFSDFIAEVVGLLFVVVVIDGRNITVTAKNGRIITSVM